MVLILQGCDSNTEDGENEFLSMTIDEHMELYLSKGFDSKEAMKQVAADRRIPKREVYSRYILKRES
jgi:16S rRNA (cytidine1402-2'-O)-methyltransferase